MTIGPEDVARIEADRVRDLEAQLAEARDRRDRMIARLVREGMSRRGAGRLVGLSGEAVRQIMDHRGRMHEPA